MPKTNKPAKDSKKEKDDGKKKKLTPNMSMMILGAVTDLYKGEITQRKISQYIKEKHDIDITEHLQQCTTLTRSAAKKARNDQESLSVKNSGSRKRKGVQSVPTAEEEGQKTPKRAEVGSGDAPEVIENTQVEQSTPLLEEERPKKANDPEDIEQAVQNPVVSRKASKKSPKNAGSPAEKDKKLSAGDGENDGDASAAENKPEDSNSHLPVKSSSVRSGKTAEKPLQTKGRAEKLQKKKPSNKKKATTTKIGKQKAGTKKQPKSSVKPKVPRKK